MNTHRAFLLLSALLSASVSLSAQEGQPKPVLVLDELTKASEASIEKGIRWLLENQNSSGLWGCEKSTPPSAAITGLAMLALAASDSTPSRGAFARPIRRALDKLMSSQSRTGQITLNDSTGIGIFYDHSTATLALAEIYGMAQARDDNDTVRLHLERAVSYLYRTQNRDGGWDAQGSGGYSDLAITCSVWMALRSAANAGLRIENANVERLERFVRNCAIPSGGFAQSPSLRSGDTRLFYPTSAGLRILYGMGHRDMEEVVRGTKMLVRKKLGEDYGGQISEWDYCAAFYAVQALLHEGGPYWKEWYPKMRDQLIKIQNPDGSWTIEYCLACKAYATALSVLCLQAPKRLLPIFQL